MENNNKEENREFYVYKHIRKDNNTCFYVGKGKGNRIKVSKRNKHFNRIRKKYGCYVVKIKENLTEKEAFALEREIIEDYVFVFGYGINIKGYYKGYNKNERLTNCTWGGEGTSGLNPYANKSEEEMEIISEKISKANKGKQLSDETKQKMSESHKGIQLSEEHKRKLSESHKGIQAGKNHPMYGKKGKDSPVYGEKNGMYGKKGKDSPVYGKKNGMWGKPSPNRSKVICTTTGETFDSMKEAATHYNILYPQYISRCCRKLCESAGELNGIPLQWKYVEDDDNESKAV